MESGHTVRILLAYFLDRRTEKAMRIVCRRWNTRMKQLEGLHTAIYSHPACRLHRIPAHPERPERIDSILKSLKSRFPRLQHIDCKLASKEQILRFHEPKYYASLIAKFEDIKKTNKKKKSKKSMGKPQMIHIDEDTAIMSGTQEAALRAAGSVCQAVDDIMRTTESPNESTRVIHNAFCVVRPPGHHATPSNAMGFCFLNNAGIGALHALATYESIQRVAVVDVDVHHGNGTEDKFKHLSGVLYLSTHQSPCFPGTGPRSEKGVNGNICNEPIKAGTGSQAFRETFKEKILPNLRRFKPHFIIISAGFDAHFQDPLAEVRLQDKDYFWMTKQIMDIGIRFSQGRVVSVLEGGYHLDAIARSAVHHVNALVEGSIDASFELSNNSVEESIDLAAIQIADISIEDP